MEHTGAGAGIAGSRTGAPLTRSSASSIGAASRVLVDLVGGVADLVGAAGARLGGAGAVVGGFGDHRGARARANPDSSSWNALASR